MAIEPIPSARPYAASAAASAPTRPLRVWLPVVLLVPFWAGYSVMRWTDWGAAQGFKGFVIVLGASLGATLIDAIWWLVFSRARPFERLLVLGTGLTAGIASVLLSPKSLVPFIMLPGLPLVLTTWTLGQLIVRALPPQVRCGALMAVLCLSWAMFPLLRGEGTEGDGQLVVRWRWSPTPEQVYLAEGQRAAEATKTHEPLTLRPGDWPGFRGPNRDGTVPGVRIATDWNQAPPKLVWQRRIGPAWSSVAVVGDRLFTQEQVGDQEAVVCLDAATGHTLWSHQDAERHDDAQGGPGPRATPTFAAGRIYALGARGILNCLDAATGDRKWSRNLVADAGSEIPMWGFSSSPLVVGDLVVVFAGGEPEKTLLAYHSESGDPAWSVQAGKRSYSSAQLATIGGVPQLLFVSDRGLSALDPATGSVLWEDFTPPGGIGVPRSVQPRVVGSNRVLFDAGVDLGTRLLDVTKENDAWVTKEKWLSKQLKPSFNDFVVHDSAVYGFDGRVFTCIDLQTGRRLWKDGRYGSGQVLMLVDQPLLIVIAESGELVLVAANPTEHQELARFPALKGKTWNHPALRTVGCTSAMLRRSLAMNCVWRRKNEAFGVRGPSGGEKVSHRHGANKLTADDDRHQIILAEVLPLPVGGLGGSTVGLGVHFDQAVHEIDDPVHADVGASVDAALVETIKRQR